MKPFFFILLISFGSMTPESNKPTAVDTGSESTKHIYATWETMEFDKCVAAWLIVRFIDEDAEFVFYPPGTDIKEGVTFDVPGTAWSRKHRKCTSDSVFELIDVNDIAAERIVTLAHRVEINYWQLHRWPLAEKCFRQVKGIIEEASDPAACFAETRLYFDALYRRFKNEGMARDLAGNLHSDEDTVSPSYNMPSKKEVCKGVDDTGSTLSAGYRGIEFCLSCHRDKTTYIHTLHPKKIQGPPTSDQTPVLNTVIDGAEVSIFDSRTEGYETYIEPWAEFFNKDNVAYVIGGNWKQQFMTKVIPTEVNGTKYTGRTILPGNDYAVMGIQWNVHEQKWQDYQGPVGSNEWYMSGRLARNKCTGCHVTGFSPKDATWVDKDSSLMQKGLSCETCHLRSGDAKKIVNPAKDLTFIQQVELCGSCHSRGASVGANGKRGSYGFPYNEVRGRTYEPGDRLSDFYIQSTDSSFFWPNGYSKKQHQQYNDLLLSKHLEAEVGCISCHSIHHGENPHHTRLPGGKLCLNCHEDITESTDYRAHSGHNSQDAECLDCHMPYTVKIANAFDGRSHTFKIVRPSQTIAQGSSEDSFSGAVDPGSIPNSCNSSCHNDQGPGSVKTNARAQRELRLILDAQ